MRPRSRNSKAGCNVPIGRLRRSTWCSHGENWGREFRSSNAFMVAVRCRRVWSVAMWVFPLTRTWVEDDKVLAGGKEESTVG